MKKMDRLILKSFMGPMVLTFAIAVFVLLMQFIWKYVDDIAGKGLSVGIIAELLLDASATFVPMALPIAILFASIMAMGNLGEHYELVAIKGGGIPLWRVMVPMSIVVLLLTGVAFSFANYVMPSAVLKYRTTLYDITRKKPALNIRPGEYYSEIDGFVIRVNDKDPDGKTLHDITIYDHRSNNGKPAVVKANSGLMQISPDERYLVFTLFDGCSYNEVEDANHSDEHQFSRIYFKRNEITFDLSEFAFSKTDENIFQGGYQMMNISQLDSNIIRLKARREEDMLNSMNVIRIRPIRPTNGKIDVGKCTVASLIDSLDEKERARVYERAIQTTVRQLDEVKIHKQIYSSQSEYINRHYIEWHRKFTLSIACLVLFLVGAPFGSIVRKGGLGVPLVASVAFFVLYYVVGMIAEKAVREGAIGNVGMWISTFVMLPVGLLLTWRSVKN